MQNYHYRQLAKQTLKNKLLEKLPEVLNYDEPEELRNANKAYLIATEEHQWMANVARAYKIYTETGTIPTNWNLSNEDKELIKNFKPSQCEIQPFSELEMFKKFKKIGKVNKELNTLYAKFKNPILTINNTKIVDNVKSNLIQIYFLLKKPTPTTKKKLENAGFIWSRFYECYQSKKTTNTKDVAISIVSKARKRK